MSRGRGSKLTGGGRPWSASPVVKAGRQGLKGALHVLAEERDGKAALACGCACGSCAVLRPARLAWLCSRMVLSRQAASWPARLLHLAVSAVMLSASHARA